MRDLRRQDGSALVEFSLLASMIIFMFFGIVDFAVAIQRAMVVTETAHIIAEYGTIYPSNATGPNATNSGNMAGAASYAAGFLSGMTVTPTYFYVCTPGGAHVTVTTTCPTYATPLLYVQVNSSANVSALVSYPGLPTSFALQGASILRVP